MYDLYILKKFESSWIKICNYYNEKGSLPRSLSKEDCRALEQISFDENFATYISKLSLHCFRTNQLCNYYYRMIDELFARVLRAYQTEHMNSINNAPLVARTPEQTATGRLPDPLLPEKTIKRNRSFKR